MSILDLLGTVAGATFLVGSVALAIRMDRRESAATDPATETEVLQVTAGAPDGRRGLRLVHHADQ